MDKQEKRPNYGNWISRKVLYLIGVLGIFCLLLSVVFFVLIVGAVLCFAGFIYFAYAWYRFSPQGGNLQVKIREAIMDYLSWNGKGIALDIGCGNAALTISLAKRFPSAKIVGLDFWSGKWEYSKRTCEENAQVEGVANRVQFRKASAAKLPFSEEYFDAAVSNMVFHEVNDVGDKREVIKEALRVVKKGGKFAFQDPFLMKKMYGDIDRLLNEIRSWGIEEVQFSDTSHSEFIPKSLKPKFMLGAIGVIYGTK